nr:hypothetical protein CFP56_18258 [Quercus suber]
MILIKLFKLDAITLKQRLMVEFFIIFIMMLMLRLLKESLVISARLWRCLRLWMEVPILHLTGIIEPRIRS